MQECPACFFELFDENECPNCGFDLSGQIQVSDLLEVAEVSGASNRTAKVANISLIILAIIGLIFSVIISSIMAFDDSLFHSNGYLVRLYWQLFFGAFLQFIMMFLMGIIASNREPKAREFWIIKAVFPLIVIVAMFMVSILGGISGTLEIVFYSIISIILAVLIFRSNKIVRNPIGILLLVFLCFGAMTFFGLVYWENLFRLTGNSSAVIGFYYLKLYSEVIFSMPLAFALWILFGISLLLGDEKIDGYTWHKKFFIIALVSVVVIFITFNIILVSTTLSNMSAEGFSFEHHWR